MQNILPKSSKKNKLNLLLGGLITTCIAISTHSFAIAADNLDSYSSTSQPIYSASDLSSQIGTLEIATAVKVLENSNDADKVELILWKKSDDANDIWYERLGLNILSTTFNDSSFLQNKDNFSLLETIEDPTTNTEWQKIKTNVWIKKGSLNASNDTIWNAAKKTYQTHCSECHDLPLETHATANDWPEVFAEMVDSTEMNDTESKLVLKYLQYHSSDFKKEQ